MTTAVLLFGAESDPAPARPLWPHARDRMRWALLQPSIVFVVVLATSLLGILLQPHGLLSSFWMANAVLLGLMLRAPSLATHSGWIAAAIGFLAADLFMGSSIEKTALLTLANLAGVATCFVLFRKLDPNELRLDRPFSVMHLLAITLAGSAAAGVVGMAANPLLFQRSVVEGFSFWFISELTNYLAVLPIMLTAPGLTQLRKFRLDRLSGLRFDPFKTLPVLACLLGVALAPLAHGASALVFPLPGLVWCALVYDVAVVAALSAVMSGWMLVAGSMQWVNLGFAVGTFPDLLSFRLGIALVLLGPISIASVMTSRNVAVREARIARAAAEKAMASRALLLAAMTHELRSPLNSIVGFAHLIQKPPRGASAAELAEYVEFISQAGTHLNELVTDLLDTAKVEAGKFTLALAPASSFSTLQQSTRLVAGMAMERKVHIEIEDGYWPTVEIDPRAIKQVMINLLSNAVKASSPKSTVKVSGTIRNNRLVVRVADTGTGISPDDLARLGRPYAQATSRTPGEQGTGLGLVLSMDLIRQHGGALRLESAPGEGTTATFDLALAHDLPANDD